MGIFSKFFTPPKIIANNPALEYVKSKSSLTPVILSKSASDIYSIAENSAQTFARYLTEKKTKKLAHFFYDFYIVSLLGEGELRQFGNDISSAFIDAMHIHYYGLPSETVVDSGIVQLWTLPKDFSCFYRTFISESAKESYFHTLTTTATYCLGEASLGKGLFAAEPFGRTIKQGVPKAKSAMKKALSN